MSINHTLPSMAYLQPPISYEHRGPRKCPAGPCSARRLQESPVPPQQEGVSLGICPLLRRWAALGVEPGEWASLRASGPPGGSHGPPAPVPSRFPCPDPTGRQRCPFPGVWSRLGSRLLPQPSTGPVELSFREVPPLTPTLLAVGCSCLILCAGSGI